MKNITPVKPQHKHLIVRAKVQDPLTDPNKTVIWMEELAKLINMKIIMGPFAKRVEVAGNVGVTAIAGIETSHMALHVWEEEDPPLMQLDVYTCGEMNHNIVFMHMKQFIPTELECLLLDREHCIAKIELEVEK